VALEPHRLEQALLAVIEHHDALRLRFTQATAMAGHASAGVRRRVLWQVRVAAMDSAQPVHRCPAQPRPANGPLLRLLVDGPKVSNACSLRSITWWSTACRGACCWKICKRVSPARRRTVRQLPAKTSAFGIGPHVCRPMPAANRCAKN
jgi:hypothetical protein